MRPGGLQDELGGVDLAVHLKIEIQQIPARGGCARRELHVRTGKLVRATGGRAFGVHMQVGQIALTEGNEVSVGAQVRLQGRHRVAVSADAGRDHRGAGGTEASLEADLKASHVIGRAYWPRQRWCYLAGHGHSAGQREGGSGGRGHEISEDAIAAGSGPLPRQRPPPTGVHRGVHVPIVAAICGDDDRMQLFVVGRGKRGDGATVRAGDGECQLAALTDAGGGC